MQVRSKRIFTSVTPHFLKTKFVSYQVYKNQAKTKLGSIDLKPKACGNTYLHLRSGEEERIHHTIQFLNSDQCDHHEFQSLNIELNEG